MEATYHVEVDGQHRGDAFTDEGDAHAWAHENLGTGVFYTVTKVGPNRTGSTAPELFKTPEE